MRSFPRFIAPMLASAGRPATAEVKCDERQAAIVAANRAGRPLVASG